jgi:hypothetical protein
MHPHHLHPEPATKWCPLCGMWRPGYEDPCRRCGQRLLGLDEMPPPMKDWSDVCKPKDNPQT